LRNQDPFSELLIDRLNTVSSTEQEAIALALGFAPNINNKIRDKYFKKCLQNQNVGVRRSAIVGIAFSSLLSPSKRPKSQQKQLKKYFKDPLSSIKLAAALGQGINAKFSENKKYKSMEKLRRRYESSRNKSNKVLLLVWVYLVYSQSHQRKISNL
jgi:hypothetical protein